MKLARTIIANAVQRHLAARIPPTSRKATPVIQNAPWGAVAKIFADLARARGIKTVNLVPPALKPLPEL